MLREASQDATLAATSRIRPVKRRMAGPPQSNRGPGSRRPDQPQQDSHEGVGSRGGRPQYSNSWLRGGNRYVLTPKVRIESVPVEKVGARLLFFADRWKDITDDLWILEGLSEGVKLDFVNCPVQRSVPGPVAMSREMKKVCDTEVKELLAKQAIVEVTDGSHGFICSLFVIPKKSGGFRPIVNLKPLNQFIQYEHFKMENLDSARFLLRKGDWMVKLDLKDAYLTIPVHPSHQKFLRFKWKGRIFQFKCLAFGLAPAPRIFTKILKAVMGFLRKQGMRLIIYLDDILILNRSREGAAKDFKQVVDLLLQLGFLINWEKTVADPAQKLEYLGLMLDSCRLSFALPSAKALAVKSMCESALAVDSISLREIASIMGNFTWAIPAIPFAQAHFRSMQSYYISRARRAGYDLKTKCVLSAAARLDLQWWISSLKVDRDKLFFPDVTDLEIYTDASLSGWGACCNGVRTRGSWTAADTKKHINELELVGALFAVQAFAAKSSSISIRIYLDNVTAVAYVNHCGGTRSKELTLVSAELTSWCEARDISIEAVHVAGRLNVIADEESRAGPDSGDWKLDPMVFERIQQLWPSDVDVFASPWNAHLPAFISWFPQPGAMATNAFSVNWKGLSGYIFPPFALIFKCIEKIRRERATAVFVCPVWTGQPWFPLLLELVCDVPRLLTSSPVLLTSALGESHPLISSNALHLAAWKLSGDSSKGEDFRRQLSSYSWPAVESTQHQRTSRPGAIGQIGAWENVRIPCQTI
uniref:Reverse transcriptase n=1 Tax=Daphnia pulex TaxID=6669 RepID=B2CN81_DAPPU|nr:reverse transcriptase [Daphnia pulex]